MSDVCRTPSVRTGVGAKTAARKAVGRNIKNLRDRNKKGDKEKERDIRAEIAEENRGKRITSSSRVIFEKLDLDKSFQDTLSQNIGNWKIEDNQNAVLISKRSSSGLQEIEPGFLGPSAPPVKDLS